MQDAITARRRARAGMGALLAFLVLPFAVCGVAELRAVGVVLGLLAVPLGMPLFGELCEERPPARHSAIWMTARTLTGVRRVDLRRLADVRLVTTFSYGTVHRTLLVCDTDGIRIGVTSAAGRRVLRTALERRGEDGARPAPRVSRAARAFLGTGRRGHLVVHTLLVFLVRVVAVCGYVVAVVEVGGAG